MIRIYETLPSRLAWSLGPETNLPFSYKESQFPSRRCRKSSSSRSRINNIQQYYNKSREIKSGHVAIPVRLGAGKELHSYEATMCQLSLADYFGAADKFRTGPSQLYDPGRVWIRFKSWTVFDLLAPDGATSQWCDTYRHIIDWSLKLCESVEWTSNEFPGRCQFFDSNWCN
jgi:hypothetical protein